MVVEVLTSWDIKDGASLQSKVRIFSDLMQENAMEYIDEKTCFNLNKPVCSDPPDCDIRLLLKPKNSEDHIDLPNSLRTQLSEGAQVGQIILFSEAKLLEVYTGPFEEYSQTIRSESLSLNDSSMYKTVICLSPPQKFIRLQLKRLHSSNSTSIYGILLNIALAEEKEFSVSLPKSPMSQQTQNIGSATFMMEALKCFSSFKDLNKIESKSKEDARSFTKESLGNKQGSVQHNVNDLENRLYTRMDEMEKNLINRIDSKFEQLHKKIEMKFANIELLLGTVTDS